MRSLDGKPVRIKAGAADRMNKALAILGFAPAVSQTSTTLKIGSTKVNCPRTYDTMKSIEFDNKVLKVLREFCQVNGIDIKAIEDEYDVVNKKVAEICPKRTLSEYPFNHVSTKDMQQFLAQAKAVEEYYSNPEVQSAIERREALNELFKSDWDEVVTE